MLILTIISLSGGQGKTTTALFLGRKLSAAGYPTLMIDADPQHNLTTYLGLELTETEPTLLEFLKKSVDFEDAIYPLEGEENLFCLPADEKLDNAVDYLSHSGVGATLLKRRLEIFQNTFKVCIIDSPPQRSQIALTAIGAAEGLIIPAEATIKGYGSLVRTLDLLLTMREVQATMAEVWGVLPFRDRWIGRSQTHESRLAIEGMKEEVGPDLILPSILESERYKQAINQQKTLSALGFSQLEYPFEVLFSKIEAYFNHE
jgi:chromosome partitioning protein